MDYFAVAGTDTPPNRRFTLEQHGLQAKAGQPPGTGQSDHACADNGCIEP